MESFDVYAVNDISRETAPDEMRNRYYGLRPIDGLLAFGGRRLRDLGFALVPNSGSRVHEGIWKRMEPRTHIVCYITPPTDRQSGHVSLRYVDFKLKAVDFPLNQETAKLLLAGYSNSALMASEGG